MMDDRELLEMAAKAAFGDKSFIGDMTWNPLTDDGDALRLQVALHFTVRCYMGTTCVQSTVPGGPSVYIEETNHADPYAATRRCIVRAAAELARAGAQKG